MLQSSLIAEVCWHLNFLPVRHHFCSHRHRRPGDL